MARGFWQVLAIMGALWSAGACAQELSPRAYWPTPRGTRVLMLSYLNSSGGVLTDPSLPATGVKANINYAQLDYQQTFSLFSRTAILQATVPYAHGSISGFLEGDFVDRNFAGPSDARLRLAVNLLGAPSMDGKAFRELAADPGPIIGASLLLQAPSGEYDSSRLINTGGNRWAIKPAIGAILPIRRTLLFECEIGVWLYGDNNDYLGQKREQKPIWSAQAHLVKVLRSGVWAAVDANYYHGGRTRIEAQQNQDEQRNSRMGVTLLFPLTKGHALRTVYSRNIATSAGGDFDSFSLSWVYAWL
jgi:hypothetical protein